MNKQEIVLAAMSTAQGAEFSPVQVQKLFFLIDMNIPNEIGGEKIFNHEAYNYGPFDITVYDTLRDLAMNGLVDIGRERNWNTYRLTVEGQKRGNELFLKLPARAQKYISALSDFVRSLSFTELVRAVYKAYPEMRANSVFQG